MNEMATKNPKEFTKRRKVHSTPKRSLKAK